jgi:hypothetical protein
MTDVLYEYGQKKNEKEIDEMHLNRLLDEFIEGVGSRKEMMEIELKNYIHGKGEWKIDFKRD